jgi:hypothetical protein
MMVMTREAREREKVEGGREETNKQQQQQKGLPMKDGRQLHSRVANLR